MFHLNLTCYLLFGLLSIVDLLSQMYATLYIISGYQGRIQDFLKGEGFRGLKKAGP